MAKAPKAHAFNAFAGGKGKAIFPYCSRCGLVLLKNEATQKAVNKPCPGRDENE